MTSASCFCMSDAFGLIWAALAAVPGLQSRGHANLTGVNILPQMANIFPLDIGKDWQTIYPCNLMVLIIMAASKMMVIIFANSHQKGSPESIWKSTSKTPYTDI